MTRFFSYILRCSDGTLYSGYTTDPVRRLKAHNLGRGARYTRSRRPVTPEALWEWDSRSDAMSAEALVKKMTRSGKEDLIASRLPHPKEGGKRVSFPPF